MGKSTLFIGHLLSIISIWIFPLVSNYLADINKSFYTDRERTGFSLTPSICLMDVKL